MLKEDTLAGVLVFIIISLVVTNIAVVMAVIRLVKGV
jgi:hypothetical protein